MKKSIVLLLTLFLSLFSSADAQTNEAQQRERDIRIAEGILAEIFGNQNSQYVVVPGSPSRNVQGEYVHGYGVHFTVSAGFSNLVYIQNMNSDDGDIRVEVRSDGDSSSVSDSGKGDEIKEKIYEYMTKYASLISGVPDNETIRVTYTSNQSGPAAFVFSYTGQRREKSQSGISVWASVSDLKQFRNGSISEQELMNRVSIHNLDKEETYTDFNVFASVLETALNSTNAEHLRVSRKPQMEYLPGLGVRYRVQVSTRPSVIFNEVNIFDGNFGFKMDSLRLNLEESLKLMERSMEPFVLKLDSMFDPDLSEEERERIRRELRERQHELREHRDSLRNSGRATAPAAAKAPLSGNTDLRPEADAIVDQLLNVIENYGSTLTSLGNDEMLMISINWSGRSDDLPERTEIRIKKSDVLRGKEPHIEEIERR